MPYFYVKKHRGATGEPPGSLFLRRKRTSEPKMPYFYAKAAPQNEVPLILPHRTHLGAENALFLRKKYENYGAIFLIFQISQSLSSRIF